MLQKAIPVLPVANITQTIYFFETTIGFKGKNYGNYAILKYDQVEIHLTMQSNKIADADACCLILVKNIEDLYADFCSKALVNLQDKLINRPWGLKEFTIRDNNNNLIRFGEKR